MGEPMGWEYVFMKKPRQKINLNKLDDLIQKAEGTEMQEGC